MDSVSTSLHKIFLSNKLEYAIIAFPKSGNTHSASTYNQLCTILIVQCNGQCSTKNLLTYYLPRQLYGCLHLDNFMHEYLFMA